MATAAPAKAPAHLWIVGLVALLWNAWGAFDYTMTQTHNAWYLSDFMQLSSADLAYLDGSPAWADAAWAFGVWGGLLASILLLMRSRHAVWAFGVSLAGLAVSTVYQYGMSTLPADMQNSGMTGLFIGIWVIAIALFLYAYMQSKKGVLR